MMRPVLTRGVSMRFLSKPGESARLLEQWGPIAEEVHAASPYVTWSPGLSALLNATTFRLLTQVTVGDLATGVTKVDALRSVLKNGGHIRTVPTSRRLHAKVFALPGVGVMVGSANLTFSGLDRNVEAGVVLAPEHVPYWSEWFEGQWATSLPVTEQHLDELEQRAVAAKAATAPKAEQIWMPKRSLAQQLALDLERKVCRVVMCNSNRAHVEPLVCEQWMLATGVAAAWLDYETVSTFQSLRPGDIALLHASVITKVVAIGRVTGTPTTRQFGEKGHIGPTMRATQHDVDVDWVPLQEPVHWTNVPGGTVKFTTPEKLDTIRSRLVRSLFGSDTAA